MAKNAWLGLELARDIRALDPLGLLVDLNAHSSWPFGFSLLLVPFLLAGGASFTAASALSLVSFALLPLAVVALARRVAPDGIGLVAGGAAAALLVASPLLATFATLVMRECTGLLLTLVASTLYLAARERPSLGSWRWVAAAFLALFFVKYNYGLLWLVATSIHAALETPSEARRRWRLRLAGWNPLRRDSPPLSRWLALSVLVLVATQAFGGSTGNVLFALLWLWTLALAPVIWRHRESLRRRFPSLASPARAALEIVIVPLWIWSLVPQPVHPKGVLDFLVNRASGEPIAARVTRYLAAFDGQYASSFVVDVAIATGCILGIVLGWRVSAAWRYLILTAALPFVLTVAHPYVVERFLLTSLGALFLLAALGIARAVATAGRVALVLLAVALAAAVVVAIDTGALPPSRAVSDIYLAYSGPPALRPVLAALPVLDPDGERVAVLGTFNELGQELVFWTLAPRDGKRREFVRPPSRFAADAPPAAVRESVDDWLRRKRPDAALVIRSTTGSPSADAADYRAYGLWQLRAADELAGRSGWQVDTRRSFPDLGLELSVLTHRQPGPG